MVCTAGLSAQQVTFPDDIVERGYFDRPYLRYEAEPGKCSTDGSFLEPSYDQRLLQSEASNQAAVQLTGHYSYVEWTCAESADGMTIRFSLPDSPEGTGTTGSLFLYVDGVPMQGFTLSSYWAWQYILKSGSKYPDNIPDENTKFPRMRFDEMHIRLDSEIPAGSTFRLVKFDSNTVPYTIDFVELEKVPAAVTFDDLSDENKVLYTPEAGKLQYFIAQNGGKTIFLPEGRYEVDGRIAMNTGGTRLIGAGMWYTEIYFNASSDDKSTYNKRGIEAYGSNITLEGFSLITINNKRYYNNDPAYQVGKGLMGSFGSNSLIRNLWVEHFECGGWIENADHLSIQHCRFRNNYADGMNLSYACRNSVVEHCSYRNNGDDDMASWSRSDGLCIANVYSYSTSENNWRASALGFFGGKQNKAHHIVIIDPMEAGFRVTCDFPGMAFSSEGYTEFLDISVYRGGVASGTVGISGDLWGNQQGALHLFSSSQYDMTNIYIHDIDLIDSKNDAIFIGSSSYTVKNLILKNINITGTGRYGTYYYNTRGYGSYCALSYENTGTAATNNLPSAFAFTENCTPLSLLPQKAQEIRMTSIDGDLYISGTGNRDVSVYDLCGKRVFQSPVNTEPLIVRQLNAGIYIVRWGENQAARVFVN